MEGTRLTIATRVDYVAVISAGTWSVFTNMFVGVIDNLSVT